MELVLLCMDSYGIHEVGPGESCYEPQGWNSVLRTAHPHEVPCAVVDPQACGTLAGVRCVVGMLGGRFPSAF